MITEKDKTTEATPRPWHKKAVVGLPDEDWWSILNADETLEVVIAPRFEPRNEVDVDLIISAVNERAALQERVRQLEEALLPFTNKGQLFVFHRNVAEGDYFECAFCHEEGKNWKLIQHDPKCPVGIARAALTEKG